MAEAARPRHGEDAGERRRDAPEREDEREPADPEELNGRSIRRPRKPPPRQRAEAAGDHERSEA